MRGTSKNRRCIGLLAAALIAFAALPARRADAGGRHGG